MSTENRAIVRRFVNEYMNQESDSALDALVADDFICHVGGVDSTAAEGRDAWVRRSRVLRTAFPDYHVTIEDLLADDDKVVMRYRGQVTHRGSLAAAAPTNKVMTYTGIMILRISNGRIAEEWTEYDSLGLMRQIEANRTLQHPEQNQSLRATSPPVDAGHVPSEKRRLTVDRPSTS